VKLSQISALLDSKAPCGIKMDFDNVGLLVGDPAWDIEKILIALDVTEDVIGEAIAMGAGLIVTHHPVIFSMKTATPETPTGKRVLMLAENKIAAICMHTNLDAVTGGVNDALASAAGLQGIGFLSVSGKDQLGNDYGIGRTGRLDRSMPMAEYLPFLKTALKTNGLRFYDSGKQVSFVAVGSGSCGEYMETAVRLGCDTFISADIKYDTFLDARHYGINVIDGDHYCTENVITPVLCRWLTEAFPETEMKISEVHRQIVRFF
jgi:dinuclear metal center YbgI/SA1388 family protein